VTFHEPTTSDGQGGIHRSGGDTWIAVVTFNDGSRIPILVGCGVGLNLHWCFSRDPSGREHETNGPLG
jgi:hypothetical protein